MRFFKNYDSFVITSLGVIVVIIGLIVYLIENNLPALFFTIGLGVGWILLGLGLKNYKII